MSQIEVEREAAIVRIAINRPEKKNALTADMYTALADAIEDAERNSGVRVLLCMARATPSPPAMTCRISCRSRGRVRTCRRRYVLFMRWRMRRNQIVAAVHGLVVGVGTTILLHCDLVYAAEETRFMMPFINLGIVPEAASTVLLPALIGRQRASELFMLGTPLIRAASFRNWDGECRFAL